MHTDAPEGYKQCDGRQLGCFPRRGGGLASYKGKCLLRSPRRMNGVWVGLEMSYLPAQCKVPLGTVKQGYWGSWIQAASFG